MVQAYWCAMAKLYSLFPKPRSWWYHADGATNSPRYVNSEGSPWERDRECSGDSYPESSEIPCRQDSLLTSLHLLSYHIREREANNPAFSFRLFSFLVSLCSSNCGTMVRDLGRFWLRSGQTLRLTSRPQEIRRFSSIHPSISMSWCLSWEFNSRKPIDGGSMLLCVGWRAAWVLRLWFAEDWSSEMRRLPFWDQPRDIIINNYKVCEDAA